MNIRKKILYSFIISIIFLFIISFLSFIITYQVKEDIDFRNKVSNLINLQEEMNELINFVIFDNDLEKLKLTKNNFLDFEKKFELLKETIDKKNENDFIDYFIRDIQEYQNISEALKNLYKSEHIIEATFDEIYNLQIKKLSFEQNFNQIYPQENLLRKELELLIINRANLELMQDFSNVRYYSKETLYQHKNKETLAKWLNSIDSLIDKVALKEQDLHYKFSSYKNIVSNVGEISIQMKDINSEEEKLSIQLKEILKNNKKISIDIQDEINKLTETFLNKIHTVQYSLIFVVVVINIFLVVMVSLKFSNIIKILIYGVQELQNGNYNIEINIQDNEFNKVAMTFNQMAYSINEHNILLETRIQNRTYELEQALHNLQTQKDVLENLSNKLAKYLAPQIFESIFTGKQDVVLESKRKYLTVFFSDVKGFTNLTDKLEAEALTTIINEYLDIMSNIAIKYGGTIDKYIGDSIMIFYGDPLSNGKKNDALNCIKMAIEMKEEMSKLRIKWQNDGISDSFQIRIGINSGYCTVGNFGSKNRLDYTIIGGVVNLASRLETNAMPNQILISSETYNLIKDEITCNKKDEIIVKGITHPIQTYEVVENHYHNTVIADELGFSIVIDLNDIKKIEAIEKLKNVMKTLENI